MKIEFSQAKLSQAQGVLLTSIIAALLLPKMGFSHPGHAGGHGLFSFYEGFIHPISGLDHLLMALAVGIWAASFRTKLWVGPSSFLFGVFLGALAGQFGTVLPFCEQGIILSLMLVGFFLFLGSRTSSFTQVGMLICMGMFHGNAHGLEIDHVALGRFAIVGLLISTGILHGIGIVGVSLARRVFEEQRANLCLRWVGVGLMGSIFFL